MVDVLKREKLYHNKRFHAAFPSIVVLPDDSILLAFRRARDANWLIPAEKRNLENTLSHIDHIDSRSQIVFIKLDHKGNPVSNELEMLPVDPEAGDQDSSMLVLPGNQLFLASFSWYPLPGDTAQYINNAVPDKPGYQGARYLFWGSHASLYDLKSSEWVFHHNYILPDADIGRSLSEDQQKVVAGAVRGQSVYQNHRLYLAVYGGKSKGALLFVSDDKGASWSYESCIARDASKTIAYQEPALCKGSDDELICFMRTQGSDGKLATSCSQDGINWSLPKLHKLVGYPFHPLVLKDDRVFLSYGFREGPYGIRARILSDPLQDPDEVEEIVIVDDGICPDLGYPWAVELNDNKVLVVYYMTDRDGIRYIEGTWLEI